MANRPASASKSRALAYLEFCEQHHIEPYVLLAEAAKRTYSDPVPQREIRNYLIKEEATADMRAALASWEPAFPEEEVERFFRDAWPLSYSFMFTGKSQLPGLGTLGDFQVLVSGRQSKVIGWTHESVAQHVSDALKSLPKKEREQYFPFLSFRGRDKCYDDFREKVLWQPRLPHTEAIHAREKECLFPDIYSLNKAVAKQLRIPYAIPDAKKIVRDAVQWWTSQGKGINDFRVEDVGILLDEEVIPRRIFRKKLGLFDDWNDLASQIRTSDGIERLPLNIPGYVLSREQIQERLKKWWPRLKDGEPQPPPNQKDLRKLSKDRIIPDHHKFIGKSFQFTSLFDLHRSIGYPQIVIPLRFPLSNVPRVSDQEAFDVIDDVVREMYRIGMKPQEGNTFTPQDFFAAKRLGITTTPSYVIGRGQWYLTQDEFDAAYECPYSQSLIELREGQPMNAAEADELADRAMYDIECRMVETGISSEELTETVIQDWSRDGSCPRIRDIEELFGGLHAVQICLRMVGRDQERDYK